MNMLANIHQVPSEFDVKEAHQRFILAEIPVFHLIGTPKLIEPHERFEIDHDAWLVYNYLQAYSSGRINALYNPGNCVNNSCSFKQRQNLFAKQCMLGDSK